MACEPSQAWVRNMSIFRTKLRHQRNNVLPSQARDLAQILIRKPEFTPFGPLLQQAENPSLGGLPI